MSRPAAGASPDWDESVSDGRFLSGSSLGAESQSPDIPQKDQTVRLSPAQLSEGAPASGLGPRRWIRTARTTHAHRACWGTPTTDRWARDVATARLRLAPQDLRRLGCRRDARGCHYRRWRSSAPDGLRSRDLRLDRAMRTTGLLHRRRYVVGVGSESLRVPPTGFEPVLPP